MAEQTLPARVITISGAGTIAALLFWMALYMMGPIILIVDVVALAITTAWCTRHVHQGWIFVERLLIACLVAAQAGLIIAILIRIVPVVSKHVI